MSRILPMANHQLNAVRAEVDRARAIVRKACDDANALLTKMAKDKQADDEDILAIVACRTEVDIIRKKHE